jgi:ATP/maltotriose-dependent transcriptional regulator MalT
MITQLKKQKNDTGLVIFAGAGISKYLGLPDWKQLVIELYKEINSKYGEKSILLQALESNDLPLLIALDLIKEHKKDIYPLLKKLISVPLSQTALHDKLWKLSSKIITTNYDKAFETSNPSVSAAISGFDYELATLKQQDKFLLKIHGTIDNVENCVLFKEDFDNTYQTDNLIKTVFEDLITHQTFLFIGFSFNDPYIQKIFEYKTQMYKGYLQDHYLITDSTIDYSQYGIKSIRVNDYGEALSKLLDGLISEDPSAEIITTDKITTTKTYSVVPKPSKDFTGRESELKGFEKIFNLHNLVFIEGLGGIGKTEFVTKFIETKPETNIVWLDCQPETSLEALIEIAGYSELLKFEVTKELTLFLSFRELLEQDKKIVILDNFNQITDFRFFAFLKSLKNNLKHSKLIFLSRERLQIEGLDISHFLLSGLNDSALAFAKKIQNNYTGMSIISDEKLTTICNDLDGHPFGIQLAIQLLSYEEAPENIFQIINLYKDEKEKLSNRLLSEVFNHPQSEKDQKDLLTKFSVYRTKVELTAIEGVFGDAFRQPLRKLIDKLMISKTSNLYSMHSLVREFAYEKLDNKKEVHIEAAKYYLNIWQSLDIQQLDELCYHLEKAEQLEEIRVFLEKNVEQLKGNGYYKFLNEKIKQLIDKGFETPRLYNILADLSFILDGIIDRLVSYSEKALALQSDDTIAILEAKISILEANCIKFPSEKPIKQFQELLSECEKHGFIEGKIICLSLIGKFLGEKGKSKQAEKLIKEALSIAFQIDYTSGISHCLIDLSEFFLNENRNKEAKETYDRLYEYFSKRGNLRFSSIAINGFAIILFRKNKFDEAYLEFTKTLKIDQQVGDKLNEALVRLNIADCLLNISQEDLALTHVSTALQIFAQVESYDDMSKAYRLFSIIHLKKENYLAALKNLFRFFLAKKKVNINVNVRQQCFTIKDKVGGIVNYTILLNQCIEELLPEEKSIILAEDLTLQPKTTTNRIARNDIIKVQYKNGAIVETKYKKVINDLEEGQCFIINPNIDS